MDKEIILRRLVIRSFHVSQVEISEKMALKNNKLFLSLNSIKDIVLQTNLVEAMSVSIVKPGQYNREINTIMDIIPISSKVLGALGEGVTHTITGAYVMLTGADEDGRQMAEFGSSEGNLHEKMMLNRAGTPGDQDYIIHIDVTLTGGQSYDRNLPYAAFKACDSYIEEIRKELKAKESNESTENHEFFDKHKPNKKKVVIVKQIAGQGAMYDNQLFAEEPSGFKGGKSIIDIGNVPMILSPNEYRDGALRSMT